jgi:hypothetical protein
MANQFQLKKVMRNTAAVVVQFAHGGLLVTGLLVVLFLAGRAGMIGAINQGSQEVSGIIGDARLLHASAGVADSDVLSVAEMRGVTDYISRRYRIAPPAVESLIDAARLAGERVGLDPMLIVAVMAIESGFNPIAESPLGAQGLMQVIPRYHQDKIGEGGGRHALLDPATNIQVGARVLKESIRRAGSMEAGLQQYAGASGDAEAQYAAKVLAEKQRLDAAMKRGRQAGA